MPTVNPELVEAFCAKAALVNAVVQELPNMEATLQYVVDVCEQKSPAEMLDDEPGTPKGPLGPNKAFASTWLVLMLVFPLRKLALRPAAHAWLTMIMKMFALRA